MKESRPKPNQLIVISKEASVRMLRLGPFAPARRSRAPPARRRFAADLPRPRRHARHSRWISSGTTNMPAVYSIWK